MSIYYLVSRERGSDFGHLPVDDLIMSYMVNDKFNASADFAVTSPSSNNQSGLSPVSGELCLFIYLLALRLASHLLIIVSVFDVKTESRRSLGRLVYYPCCRDWK